MSIGCEEMVPFPMIQGAVCTFFPNQSSQVFIHSASTAFNPCIRDWNKYYAIDAEKPTNRTFLIYIFYSFHLFASVLLFIPISFALQPSWVMDHGIPLIDGPRNISPSGPI